MLAPGRDRGSLGVSHSLVLTQFYYQRTTRVGRWRVSAHCSTISSSCGLSPASGASTSIASAASAVSIASAVSTVSTAAAVGLSSDCGSSAGFSAGCLDRARSLSRSAAGGLSVGEAHSKPL